MHDSRERYGTDFRIEGKVGGRCELRHENVGGYLVGASLKRIVSFLLPRESDIKGDTRIKGGI
jgi:hypothetical protein